MCPPPPDNLPPDNPPLSAEIALPSPEATARLAAWLAPRLRAGDTMLIDGPIGAGKTHFCRALIQARLAALGQSEDVPSPSYTLVQIYEAGDCAIWHVDLYRLSGAGDLSELGLDEAFATAICLVEWPDRLGRDAPATALRMSLAPVAGDEDARLARFAAGDPRWAALIGAIGSAGGRA